MYTSARPWDSIPTIPGEQANQYRTKESYGNYMRTDHWLTLRRVALKMPQFQCCELCGSRERIQLHHVDYGRLGREQPNDLRALCFDCHDRVHVELKRDGLPVGKTGVVLKRLKKTPDIKRRRIGPTEPSPQRPQCPCGNLAKRGQSKCRRCKRRDKSRLGKKARRKLGTYYCCMCAAEATVKEKYCAKHWKRIAELMGQG